MQIVIDIPDKVYGLLKYFEEAMRLTDEADKKEDDVKTVLMRAIVHGTPLPKRHGRLIDADALYDQYEYADYDFDKTMEYAYTIIEADKAESEVEDANR